MGGRMNERTEPQEICAVLPVPPNTDGLFCPQPVFVVPATPRLKAPPTPSSPDVYAAGIPAPPKKLNGETAAPAPETGAATGGAPTASSTAKRRERHRRCTPDRMHWAFTL